MLPKLGQSQITKAQLETSRANLKLSNISKANKGIEQAALYQEKYQNQLSLNSKLKMLLTNIKSNQDTSAKVYEEEEEVAKLGKQKKKWETEVQHQSNTLNVLIAQNNKLKDQVNAERNKRAIYFNVYKNLQHEIHQWESKYKNLLIESMRAEGAATKLKDKFKKAIKKVQKDIQSLNDQIQGIEHQKNKNDEQFSKPTSARSKLSKIVTLQSQKQNNAASKVNEVSPQLQAQNAQKNLSVISNQNRKSTADMELQFQIEQKNVQIQGVMTRLKQITGKNELQQCLNVLKDIDNQIQYNYNLFKEQEARQKSLIEQTRQDEEKLKKIQEQNLQRQKTLKLNLQGEQKISQLNKRIFQMQKILQQKIDIKVSQLPDEMLLHHCLRIRDENKESKRNLQKNLQMTKKQKSQCNILLSPKEMHKRIILSQTKMI